MPHTVSENPTREQQQLDVTKPSMFHIPRDLLVEHKEEQEEQEREREQVY